MSLSEAFLSFLESMPHNFRGTRIIYSESEPDVCYVLLLLPYNHDESYEKAPPEGCFCIEDQVYCCKGLRIVGLGGSMRYRPGLYQYTEAQMRRRAKQLSLKLWRTGGFDILVTHAPARGIGDEEHISHRGFQTFVDLMEKYKPAYMVHGHIHREYTSRFKRLRKCGETVVVNANKSYVIEIDDPVPQPKRRR